MTALCVAIAVAVGAVAGFGWRTKAKAKLKACHELIAALNQERREAHERHARDNDLWKARLEHCNAWLYRIGSLPKHTSMDYVAELVRQCSNGDNPHSILKRGRF